MKKGIHGPEFYDTVTVGERGQVVIPAKARNDLGIKAGDKLLAIKGLGEGALVLVNSKNLSNLFSKVVKHIGKIKELISK